MEFAGPFQPAHSFKANLFVGDRLNKMSIWLNNICFSVILLVMDAKEGTYFLLWTWLFMEEYHSKLITHITLSSATLEYAGLATDRLFLFLGVLHYII